MTDLAAILDGVRKGLLDLSVRNRLLAAPRGDRNTDLIEIVRGRSEDVYDVLVRRRGRVGFEPKGDPRATAPAMRGVPPWLPVRAGARVLKAARLETGLPALELHRRLLQLSRDARACQEERGAQLLYLSLGFLTWFETPDAQNARHAPLILIPVRLERAGARGRFEIMCTGDVVPNMCLALRLERSFGLGLPRLPGQDDLEPDRWFEAVARALRAEPRFGVEPDAMALGAFSLTRFLMWQDLDPAAWPDAASPDRQALLRSVLVTGFRDDCGGSEHRLERPLPGADALHVLEADGFQACALELARRGRNLLIQGPPGTGKSQTIANLIAASVHAGKRVLFIANKTAALEVVRRRLEALDLGGILLDLSGERADRRQVLDELQRTLKTSACDRLDVGGIVSELERVRSDLDRHARALNRRHAAWGFTPFELIGELARLGPVDTRGIVLMVASLQWAEIERRGRLIKALTGRIERIGDPGAHPWRGVRLNRMAPGDGHRLAARAGALEACVEALRAATQQVAADLGEKPFAAGTLAAIEPVLETAEFLALAPEGADPEALLDPVWQTRRDEISALAAAARIREALRAELEGQLAPNALERDQSRLAAQYTRHVRRRWRHLHPAWWLCRWQVARLCRRAASWDERARILDTLVRLQAAERGLEAAARLGRSAFGSAWRKVGRDVALLADLERWERDGRTPDLLEHAPQRLALVLRPERTAELAAQAQRLLMKVRRDLATLFDELALDRPKAFAQGAIDDLALDQLEERLAAWSTAGDALEDWVVARHEFEAARAAGLEPLARAVLQGRLTAADAGRAFDAVVFDRLLREVLRSEPELAAFDGTDFDRRLDRFRGLDRRRIELASAEVASAHAARLPAAHGGDLGVIAPEYGARCGHRSLRALLAAAGPMIQAIKPVFMMSPHAVAAVLPPDTLEFDLLVLDEAGHLEVVDALGAIARCRQMVLAGDERQLPPMSSFGRRGSHEARVEGDGGPPEPASILGWCAARGIAKAVLRCHYRSLDPSLIAVSNHALYDGRLLVVPSPVRDPCDLGITLHRLADGRYHAASRTNPAEARWIARAVLDHACTRPRLSLGVGCFSLAQRDLILAEVERLRGHAPALDHFLDGSGAEPFLVKDAHGLQGDERDVIMISIGYGPDGTAAPARDFGPLEAEGGERHLNVLASRARRRLLVVSSIGSDEIDLERSDRPGVRFLKTFLEHAETAGRSRPEPGEREPGSAFEAAVAAALRAAGLEVVHRVGSSGFFVDLAVVDPECPGRYVLGIECDGGSWRASAWTRDRDRLRQQLLEERGWILHRIWSLDWLARPRATLARTLAAVAAARTAWRARVTADPPGRPGTPRQAVAPALPDGGADPDVRDLLRERRPAA